jgi:DNA-binding transcriptional MerR regulator
MEKHTLPGIDIPDKLYFKIGEVTAITDLAAYVIRFWESEFKILSPKRTQSGQRLYRKTDVETVLMIKHLLYDRKFTIAGARKYIKEMNRKERAPAASADLNDIRSELRRLRDMLD